MQSEQQGETIRLLERAVQALERIAGALAGEAAPDVPDEVLAADVAFGMSLRACAEKHGVGLGRVRGAVTRAALTPQSKEPRND